MKLLITCLFLVVSFVKMSSSFAQSIELKDMQVEPDAIIAGNLKNDQSALNGVGHLIRLHGYLVTKHEGIAI